MNDGRLLLSHEHKERRPGMVALQRLFLAKKNQGFGMSMMIGCDSTIPKNTNRHGPQQWPNAANNEQLAGLNIICECISMIQSWSW